MTAYIANHLKKKRILEKRKQELGHVIRNNYSPEKIQRAAEKLRYAQLNVFKCDYAKRTVLPIRKYTPTEEAQQWERYSVEEIIEKYLSENPIGSDPIDPEKIFPQVSKLFFGSLTEKYAGDTPANFNTMAFKEGALNNSSSPNEENSD